MSNTDTELREQLRNITITASGDGLPEATITYITTLIKARDTAHKEALLKAVCDCANQTTAKHGWHTDRCHKRRQAIQTIYGGQDASS